jgi:hypothetical protein
LLSLSATRLLLFFIYHCLPLSSAPFLPTPVFLPSCLVCHFNLPISSTL